MARKISFKKVVAESLGSNDVATFQTAFKRRLIETLNRKKVDLVTEVLSDLYEDENTIVNQLASTALSFGGNDAVYDMGVMDIRFNDPNAVKNFTSKLEEINGIDYFEINGPDMDGLNDTGASDLEYQGNKAVYEVTVYLDLDQVNLAQDIDSYMESLESTDNEKITEGKKADAEDDEEDDECLDESEDEEDDEEEDEDEEDEECMDESLDLVDIVNKVQLKEFLTIKTAHWDQELKKSRVSTDKICPPGRTGPDCKTILSAQQKMELRKRMASHLKKMSKAHRSRMASHAAATSAFIKQHHLASKSAAKAGLRG